MAHEGIPVPDFFCLPSAAFARHLTENTIHWPESVNMSTDFERLRDLRAKILMAPVPEAVSRPALAAYDDLCSAAGHDKVAVRSSGGEEDSASSSFAGQFASILGVSTDLLDAVKECWASYLSDRSLRYRASQGIPLPGVPTFGVIVQAQVLSQKAGVLFTMHPLEPDLRVAYIEANFGTGESVVGGLTTPDAITISRSSGEVVESAIGTKRRMTMVSLEARGSSEVDVEESQRNLPVLSDSEAQAIFELGLRIEGLMGGPQDIEWAFDSQGLWILQSRPLTGPVRRR
jgi:phosphoenolpyruvate synthase/pyruvate phosphate dikinase